MVEAFAYHHPSQQTYRRHASVYQGRRNRCGGNGHAAPTSILRADLAVDEELGRFNIQLFGDVFANLGQFPATLVTGARFRLVPMLDARQVIENAWLLTPQQNLSCGKTAGFFHYLCY
jgi:hypothetical protein